MTAGGIIEKHPEIIVQDDGSPVGITHTFPCPVCRKQHAILDRGVFEPCWDCQSSGWFLVNTKDMKWWECWGLWDHLRNRIKMATRSKELFYHEEK